MVLITKTKTKCYQIIRLFSSSSLCRIGITFGSVLTYYTLSGNALISTTPAQDAYTCVLQPGEFVTEASMYEGMLFGMFPVQSGIKIVTNNQVCGPYGYSGGVVRTYKGNFLLYMHGRLGMAFDKFAFVFDKCTAV